MRYATKFIATVLLLTTSGSTYLFSESTNAIAPSSPAVASTNTTWSDTLDRRHGVIDSYVIGFGNGVDAVLSKPFRKPEPQPGDKGQIDKFISDKALEEDSEGSRLKVTPGLTLKDGSTPEARVKLDGKLRLPNFEDRVALVFSSEDDDQNVVEGTAVNPTGFGQNDRQGTATIRYYLKDTVNFKTSVDAGMRFHPKPDPRLRLRFRAHHDFEQVTARFTQSFFWKGIGGFGEKSQFDLEQQERFNFLRRLSTTVLWAEDSDGVEAGETFAFYKYLSGRRVIGFEAGVSGVLEPVAKVENYRLSIVYRKRVHRDWMFLEFEPGVEFPRERDFNSTGFFNIKLDIIFGDWDN